ncbi:hypothetical protein MHC_03380 [Mycoplasma haemocanis str. Illinois]|uniref:Uncharacterized protein n=1 Tax=Mycoplasma haemocanis (strain Illinois) TaxID=1111676 RepID=H6N7B4_MYCHN|nr:hypothetical protein [Mycoplasma haemocanis]AEW45536.1 hypothetical protein MHC_03380 [Mycoplasma haemocanis str. Illinois]
MSLLVSGIAKFILGGAVVSLGAAGVLNGLSFGEIREESLKTVSSKSIKEQNLNLDKGGSDVEQLTENTQSRSEEPKTTISESQETVTSPVTTESAPTECRLHKLIKEDTGQFEETTKNWLESEIQRTKRGSFETIKTACESNGNKDIFASNRDGWRYVARDQTRLDSKFKNYLSSKKK